MFPLLLYAPGLWSTTCPVSPHLVCTWEHLKSPEKLLIRHYMTKNSVPRCLQGADGLDKMFPLLLYTPGLRSTTCPVSPHLVRTWEHLENSLTGTIILRIVFQGVLKVKMDWTRFPLTPISPWVEEHNMSGQSAPCVHLGTPEIS